MDGLLAVICILALAILVSVLDYKAGGWAASQDGEEENENRED